MPDKTVMFRPFGDAPGDPSFAVTGDERDAGVVGELERSGGRYQGELSLFLRRVVGRDAVVVDGGAHVGVVTLLLSSLAADGVVHAFEPAPATRAYLEKNVAAAGAGNVRVTGAALGDTDGQIGLDPSEAYPAGAHVSTAAEATCIVPATTLDSWAEREGISRLDLLKLDVEGVELAALAGAAGTLSRFRPLTIVECNPVAMRRFGNRTWDDLFARMQSLFPSVGVIADGGTLTPLRSLEHLELLLGARGVVDLVGSAQQDSLWPRAMGALRAWSAVRRLRRTYSPKAPPERNFLIDATALVRLRGAPELTGTAGELVKLRVRVENGSRWWLSSDFPHHPVHLSYRVYGTDGQLLISEGHRTPLTKVLPPGESVEVDVTIQLPPAGGAYEVAITLVQEGFAWFDEVDPGTAVRVPATVT